MSDNNNSIPKIQRALVLQGGGALGEYQVGVLKVLYDKLIKCNGDGQNGEPLFDIIAGTSIGAINAAILVSNLINRKKSWKDAITELEKFWTDDKEGLSSNPDYSKWWWNDKNYQNKVASPETARKYYSVKEYSAHGTPRVCTPPILTEADNKFGDQRDNLWFYHKIDPLKKTIMKFSKEEDNEDGLNIATSWNNRQPRLLIISVDVSKGITVTFDSYHKRSGVAKNSSDEYDGITLDHIIASGTLPVFYKFQKIGERQYCDGGLLSNTPFRELLQAHQD